MVFLLSNSFKYTDQGHIAVDVARDRDALVMRVSDTGCGISQQDQE